MNGTMQLVRWLVCSCSSLELDSLHGVSIRSNYLLDKRSTMMGFGFLMMLLVIGVPLIGIIVLVAWLANRSKKQ
jgi:hypothetical protein